MSATFLRVPGPDQTLYYFDTETGHFYRCKKGVLVCAYLTVGTYYGVSYATVRCGVRFGDSHGHPPHRRSLFEYLLILWGTNLTLINHPKYYDALTSLRVTLDEWPFHLTIDVDRFYSFHKCSLRNMVRSVEERSGLAFIYLSRLGPPWYHSARNHYMRPHVSYWESDPPLLPLVRERGMYFSVFGSTVVCLIFSFFFFVLAEGEYRWFFPSPRSLDRSSSATVSAPVSGVGPVSAEMVSESLVPSAVSVVENVLLPVLAQMSEVVTQSFIDAWAKK